MRGGIIYFSGTGNTEYVSNLFKKQFQKRNINCDLINVIKNPCISNEYDFYVFGCPIHAEAFPFYFIDWVKGNIKKGNKRCIIFSTQASSSASGALELKEILEKKGHKVEILETIDMPNNYYIVMGNKSTEEDVENLKYEANYKVKKIIELFLKGQQYIKEISKLRLSIGKISYKLFYMYSKNWAKNKLKVDMNKCIKCMKCVNECPTKNIKLEDYITFNSRCISCQKCIHGCPVNAFLYKDKAIEQYKLV